MVNQQALPNIGKVLMRYQAVKEARLLLPVEFSTLSEYLHHLKAAAQALRPIGSTAMFYLAAAVSDFYIPASEMPEHKIQSSNGPLQISMKMVPKMLSPLVDWAPQAFASSWRWTRPSCWTELGGHWTTGCGGQRTGHQTRLCSGGDPLHSGQASTYG